MPTKTAVVTGASSGIGEATALKLHDLGFTVYGAARRTDRLEQLAGRGIKPLAMDVTDEDSMRAGIEEIVAETGRVDVLVNNAGYGSYGAIEDVPLSDQRPAASSTSTYSAPRGWPSSCCRTCAPSAQGRS
jgi:NADP-dependent 3-hydroxy acid dehydrogenase YdfG